MDNNIKPVISFDEIEKTCTCRYEGRVTLWD